MTQMKDLSDPVRDGAIEFVELAPEKVIHALDNDKMIFTGQCRDQAFDLFYGAVLVSTSVDEKLRLLALSQERKIRAVDGNPQANQMRNPGILATDTQPHPCAKTESRQQQWHAGELLGEKIQRRSNVALLPHASVMLAGAQSCAPKIETQHGQAARVE